MSDSKQSRARRPKSEREGPRRSAGGASASNDTVKRVEDLVAGGMRTAQMVAEATAEPVLGAAERGVQTAYSILEDVIVRGREAARRFEPPPSLGWPPNANTWSPWSGPMAPMFTPMMAPWMNVMRMWGDSLAAFVPGGAPAMQPFMSAMTNGAGPAEVRSRVQVASRQPVQVAVNLDAGAPIGALTLGALLPATGTDGPALHGATIGAVEGAALVSITVPDDQAVGTYVGTVTDGAGQRRGDVTLQIG